MIVPALIYIFIICSRCTKNYMGKKRTDTQATSTTYWSAVWLWAMLSAQLAVQVVIAIPTTRLPSVVLCTLQPAHVSITVLLWMAARWVLLSSVHVGAGGEWRLE